MSDDKEVTEITAEDIIQPSAKRKSTLLVLLLVGVIVILLGFIGFLFSPFGRKIINFSPQQETAKEEVIEEEPKEFAFVTLPDILSNLRSRTHSDRPSFLKLVLVLRIATAHDKEPIEAMKPIILDQFQIFLRELEIEDISGASGLQRLRQELLNRANNVVSPKRVVDVLFKEILVQ